MFYKASYGSYMRVTRSSKFKSMNSSCQWKCVIARHIKLISTEPFACYIFHPIKNIFQLRSPKKKIIDKLQSFLLHAKSVIWAWNFVSCHDKLHDRAWKDCLKSVIANISFTFKKLSFLWCLHEFMRMKKCL